MVNSEGGSGRFPFRIKQGTMTALLETVAEGPKAEI